MHPNGFWSWFLVCPLNFLWKWKSFTFLSIEMDSGIVWSPNCHRLQALIINNTFYYHNMLIWQSHRTTNCKQVPPSDFQKSFFFRSFLRSNFRQKFRSLIFRKFWIFQFIWKWVGDNPHNVYIFLMGGSRAFKRRINHVHTTSLDNSTSSQLAPQI